MTQALIKNLSEEDPDDQITDLLIDALQSAMHDPLWKSPSANATNEIKQGIIDQNRIGWQQIVCGRFARTLTRYGQINNNQNLRRKLRLIWDTMLTLWKQQNEEVHH
jgi:hypothetical protein